MHCWTERAPPFSGAAAGRAAVGGVAGIGGGRHRRRPPRRCRGSPTRIDLLPEQPRGRACLPGACPPWHHIHRWVPVMQRVAKGALCPWFNESCLDLASRKKGRVCSSLPTLQLVCRRTLPLSAGNRLAVAVKSSPHKCLSEVITPSLPGVMCTKPSERRRGSGEKELDMCSVLCSVLQRGHQRGQRGRGKRRGSSIVCCSAKLFSASLAVALTTKSVVAAETGAGLGEAVQRLSMQRCRPAGHPSAERVITAAGGSCQPHPQLRVRLLCGGAHILRHTN